MEFKCSHPGCQSTFTWLGRGRKPQFCIIHRIEIKKQKAALWTKTHYRKAGATLPGNESIDPESIKRPPISHLFSGPGLFESTEALLAHALLVKSRTLSRPVEYIRTEWIHGQAGRQFMETFMRPSMR